jgi:hypothetical protein
VEEARGNVNSGSWIEEAMQREWEIILEHMGSEFMKLPVTQQMVMQSLYCTGIACGIKLAAERVRATSTD